MLTVETMPSTLQLVNREPITFESATQTDENIINQSAYVAATTSLYRQLWAERNTISAIVKHHLGLGHLHNCTVERPVQWIRGSFNVCVPVTVASGSESKRYILRCPMAHKLAEAPYPGTVDEKLGCEVGTYAWMQDNCPDIRIPFLYGFGFSDHRHVRSICLPFILLRSSLIRGCLVHTRDATAMVCPPCTRIPARNPSSSSTSRPITLYCQPDCPPTPSGIHAT